jgi:hypothetical protein
LENISNIKISLDSDNMNKMEFREDILSFQKDIKNLLAISTINNNSLNTNKASVIGSKDIKIDN